MHALEDALGGLGQAQCPRFLRQKPDGVENIYEIAGWYDGDSDRTVRLTVMGFGPNVPVNEDGRVMHFTTAIQDAARRLQLLREQTELSAGGM